MARARRRDEGGSIRVRGARTHNLKGIDVEIPKNRLVVVTGVSGSGKSSLVFDTVYAEAQRQLYETLSAHARRRLPKAARPEAEAVENLPVAIVIDQRRLGANPRSTVGTATEIHNHLRVLFSRCGTPRIGESKAFSFNDPAGMCPSCHGLGTTLEPDLDALLDRSKSLAEGAILHPHFHPKRWLRRVVEASGLFDMRKPLGDFSKKEMDLLLFAEKFVVERPASGAPYHVRFEGIVTGMKRRGVNRDLDPEEEIRGEARFFRRSPCEACGGARLNEAARSVRLAGRTLPEVSAMELVDLDRWIGGVRGPVAGPVADRARRRVRALVEIGVGYLSLDRAVGTLSGGESQRVKTARQLGCDLVGLLYLLDEPSVGLHQRDIAMLLGRLRELRDRGNSVVVVEHDPAVIERADHVIDLGPGAGTGGGRVVFEGTVAALRRAPTVTGRALSAPPPPLRPRRAPQGWIEVRDASLHNLRGVTARFPTGVLTCVTGVAGSGKSTLVCEVLARREARAVLVDQAPTARSSRSIPLTYVGVFDAVRRVFAEETGRPASIFSFNSEGACPACRGLGAVDVEMHFLEDARVVCGECDGRRFAPEVLRHRLRGRSILDVLTMTVDEGLGFFTGEGAEAEVLDGLAMLRDVGLEYLELGQTLSTLSGGEAQRLKLATELRRRGRVYVLDEPTTGLHRADIERLLRLLDALIDGGNTAVVIEHNLDVIRRADWVIDLGPGGGRHGGRILAEGTPEAVARSRRSHTGRFLRAALRSAATG